MDRHASAVRGGRGHGVGRSRPAAQAFLTALPLLFAVASFSPAPVRQEFRRTVRLLLDTSGPVLAQVDEVYAGGDRRRCHGIHDATAAVAGPSIAGVRRGGAPVSAPTAASTGIRKIRPNSVPHRAPPAAPLAVGQNDWRTWILPSGVRRPGLRRVRRRDDRAGRHRARRAGCRDPAAAGEGCPRPHGSRP
jgi:hypothetical protein